VGVYVEAVHCIKRCCILLCNGSSIEGGCIVIAILRLIGWLFISCGVRADGL